MDKKNIVAIVQARMGSTRFPGKALAMLGKKTVFEHVVERTAASREVGRIVVATTRLAEDDALESLCGTIGVPCYRGSTDDVLERFFEAAKKAGAEHIVRVCADSPFIDPVLMDRIVADHLKKKADFTYMVLTQDVLWGTASCVFNYASLEKMHMTTKSAMDREHVTLYMLDHPAEYRMNPVFPDKYMMKPYRVTLDTKEDYEVIRKVYDALGGGERMFFTKEIMDYLEAHPEVTRINAHVKQKHV